MYWLCITTEENWKVIKQKNVWVPERHKNTIAKVKPGDKLLIYLKQERAKPESGSHESWLFTKLHQKSSKTARGYSNPHRE